MQYRSQGVHGSGGRTFTPSQRASVVSVMLQHIGRRNILTLEQITELTSIAGRTVRQIISECDGVEFVNGGAKSGYFVAEYLEETVHGSAQLRSQALQMLARADRRDALAKSLPIKSQQRDMGF